MQKVFSLTNKFISLATPLILFSLITNIYIAVSMNGKLINILIAFILLILMTAAFISGWFYLIKRVVEKPEMPVPNLIIKDFSFGVGEYFLSSLGAVFSILIFSLLFLYSAFVIGKIFIGDPGVSIDSIAMAFQTPETLKTFVASLTQEQLLKINQWNMLLFVEMAISYFILILYLPVLFFKNKNAFQAFFMALKDLFSKNFFKTLGVYLIIFITNLILSILITITGANIIAHFVFTLINFYFITLASVGVFYYYYTNFIAPQLGQNVDIQI